MFDINKTEKKCTRFYSKETVQNVHFMWANYYRSVYGRMFNVFSEKNVSVTRRSVTNWKFRAFDRSNIDLVARNPGLSTRSFLPHFLSISTHHFGHWLQETLDHLPSNAYQTFHNRLQPWELWEEPAFFSFFQINSGRDVNDSYCHHECKVKQVGAPSLRVS